MGSGMSHSIEDAKSRYQCKQLTFNMMCWCRKLPYSPGHWEFILVCSFPHPFWKFQFSCSLSTTNFSFHYHPPPPPPPKKFPVFLHGVGMCISLKHTNLLSTPIIYLGLRGDKVFLVPSPEALWGRGLYVPSLNFKYRGSSRKWTPSGREKGFRKWGCLQECKNAEFVWELRKKTFCEGGRK